MRDFSPSQGLKSEGILCVFQTFLTAGLAEKIRQSVKTQLRGAALDTERVVIILMRDRAGVADQLGDVAVRVADIGCQR